MNNGLLKKIKGIATSPYLWSAVLLAAVVYFFLYGIGNVSSKVTSEQLAIIENNVRRSAVQCYALEGRYPDDINYLVEGYGLVYDDKKFVVHYENIGSNMMPQISAFYLGEKK